jgi:hypothetical protein
LVKTISITAWRVMFEDLKKEHNMARYSVIFASVFLVLTCMSVATAQMPGASGDDTKITDPALINDYAVIGTTIEIGGPGQGGPVGMYLDPNAGPWQKTFFGVINGSLNIIEHIVIGANPTVNPPGPPWTDWDELIKTPGWHWQINPVPTLTLSDHPIDPPIPGIVSTNGVPGNPNNFVVFNFAPENPGVVLTVTKTLVWNGPGPAPLPGTPASNVLIYEYPTPEPSTIVLLISGLLALGLGYIRRRR